MHILRDFFLGLRSYWKAFLFIREHRLYWYALFPASLVLGIYELGHWLRQHRFETDTHTMNGPDVITGNTP